MVDGRGATGRADSAGRNRPGKEMPCRRKLGGQGFREFTLGGCFMEEMNLVNSLIKSTFIQQFFWQAERGCGLCLALGRHRLA